MTTTITHREQHWSHAAPADAARLRDAAALEEFLARADVPRTSVGMYWHVLPYLMEGIPGGYDEPYRWFLEGGELLGSNETGDVRYLSPEQVERLHEALDGEEPDELGYGVWDEAKMDQRGVYPQRWAQLGEDSDHLGTVRELYSYLREHVASAAQQHHGLVIHLASGMSLEFDDTPRAPAAPAAEPAKPAAPPGELLLTGPDRSYHRADPGRHAAPVAKVIAAADAAMAAAGFHPVGEFNTSDDPDAHVRCYLSADRTVAGYCYAGERAAGLYLLYSLLEGDALVAASGGFITEIKKRKFFADFLQNKDPRTLHDALLARRAKLEKKHGKPVAQPDALEACVALWEGKFARLR